MTKKKPSSPKYKVDLLKGKLLYDNILVRPMKEEGDDIIVKPMQYEDKDEYGEVVLVGEGRIFDNGTVLPLKVKPGDKIFFQKWSATKVRNNAEDLLIIREEDVYEILD